MDSKALVEQCYDLFGKGDMEGFMNIVHDDFIWVYPGDKHPFSGTHNKEGFQKQLMNENIRFGIRVPAVDNLLSPILLTIPIQLLAYHVALLKGCDIDKPRNLAKSVTVE